MQLVVPEGAATFGDLEMFILIEDPATDPLLIAPDQID
jgi:hypothetical protein